MPIRHVDPAEIAKYVGEILNPTLRLILKAALLATLGAVHTLDLMQACAVIKVSDTTLRNAQLLNNLGDAVSDP